MQRKKLTKNFEFYTQYKGPRESCEDSMCHECGVFFKNATAYKACKQTCFNAKRNAIKECCVGSCSGMGSECINACNL